MGSGVAEALFTDDLRVFRPTLEDDRIDLDPVAGEIAAEVAAEQG